MGEEQTLQEVYSVIAQDFTLAGEASSRIKNILKQLGIASGLIRKVSIAAYEAELNIVIHSVGGEIVLSVTPEMILLTMQDRGPGIADVNLAMQEGYSTAPESARMLGFGAGMGLPNMKRCADEFSIESELGVGTCIQMRFAIQ